MALAGAQALSWSVAGRELLWARQTGHWDAVAPVLFPCVGWSAGGVVRFGGERRPMPVHGFASASTFALVERTADAVTFELTDNPATRARYPFAFRLRVRYALGPDALRVVVEAHNPGVADAPYALGLHPGFAWPFAGGETAAHSIVFAESERAEVPVITPGGLFTARMRPIPLVGRRLPLTPDLFADEALCFLHARSRAVRFEAPSGDAIVVEAEGFRHWALWSRPGAPFLCVESWTGHGDPDGFEGEFADKPSIDWLAPGQSRVHAAAWRFEPAGG